MDQELIYPRWPSVRGVDNHWSHERPHPQASRSADPRRLFQHNETTRMVWMEDSPGPRWDLVPTMHEDELPRNMSDEEYDAWYEHSHVPGWVGCRVGPRVRA